MSAAFMGFRRNFGEWQSIYLFAWSRWIPPEISPGDLPPGQVKCRDCLVGLVNWWVTGLAKTNLFIRCRRLSRSGWKLLGVNHLDLCLHGTCKDAKNKLWLWQSCISS